MKVAGFVHFSLPWRNCGSEVVLHELFKAAAQAGHEVTVWCTHKDANTLWKGTEPETTFDGVRIIRVRNPLIVARKIGSWRPDVMVTHHQHSVQALKTARAIKARSVYLVHNDFDINRRPLLARPDLVVFNSDWVRESLSRFGTVKQSMTFHPPLTPDRHQVDSTGQALTLVNLNPDKGANLFYELARVEPHRQFLGVVGGHGRQVIKRIPNVQIMEHGPDMKRVWSQTRVLLMPSVQESYGLVAVEAGLNGIPTIAHPTHGLKENLGAGGLFADRDSPAEWVSQFKELDGQFEYGEASEYARSLAGDAMKKSRDTLNRWVAWLDG